jgi:hypothetical protein
MTDPRVSYFCHEKNIGPIRNFIHAIECVDTPFFSFLSDDDVLLPQFYQTAMEGFRNYPEALLSATATLQMDTAGRILSAPVLEWTPGLYLPPDGFVAMLDKLHPEWTSVVLRREVLKEVGRPDEETGAPFDLDYELRIAARFPIVVSNEPGAIFVEHAESFSSSPKLCTTWPGWLKMIENQTEDERVSAGAREHAKTVLTRRLVNRLFMTHGLGAILRRDWKDSRESARILRSCYKLWAAPSILDLVGWACEHLPLVHSVAIAVGDSRRLLARHVTRRRQRPVQRRFGHWAEYLR